MTTLRDEDLLTPADAAEVLELSGDMVRLLARSGRLPTAARSVRGARLFRRDDVEQLAAERAGRLVCRHEVQFYESPEFLSQVVAEYLGQALALNARALVIAVPGHRAAFARALADAGHDVARLQDEERLILLDARQTLSQFMVNGAPDPVRFRKSVGSVVERYASPFPKPRLHAYGEMVDLLWKDGAYSAAIELEELWNALGREQPFSLLCGYSIGHFGPPDQEARFARVCSAHSRVAPTERYQRHNSRNARLLEIASLQRQSVALEQERAAREDAENQVKRLRELVRVRDSEVTRSHQAREALLRRLSHELRDPLAPIVSTLELAAMHQDPTRQEALIARQVKQLVKSIDGLIAEEGPLAVAPQLASLDLAPPPPPARAETEEPPPPRLMQTDCKVLIVDDNVDAAASLAEILEELGYAARMAHDAEGALSVAKTFMPHIALLDIGLPGTSGIDLARMFKAQPETASTRLVAVTGYSRNVDREKSRAAGCEAHLVKPVDLHALEKTLQRLMAGRSP